MILTRVVIVVVAAAALAGCGGGEGGAEEDVTAPSTEAADPREGYFTSAESEALNPPLGRFSDAWNEYAENGDACNEEAERLFEDGASPRRAVRCHLRANGALVDATDEIRAALAGLEGDYRPECEAGIERFSAALEEARSARRRVLDGFERYARSGQVAPRLEEQSGEASDLSWALVDDELVALTEACYTEEDREEAEQGSR